MDKYDFIAIGDIATDAFIKLKTAEIKCDENKENCQISMPFGDKIPFEDSIIVPAVGNSPNAAVSASRLGLKTALVTNIGDDLYGKEDIEALIKENIATDFVKINPSQKSNYHFVLLFNGERTILIKHEDYPYSLPDIGKPRWIYLSSLSETSLPFHQEIAKYLSENPDVKLAFQPGTFQMSLGYEALKDIYAHSEIFFCNVEEAKKILGIDPEIKDRKEEVKVLLKKVSELGPKKVVITDGPKGAYAIDGENYFFMPPYPDRITPIDRTGAGDSFSSTVVAALALDFSLENALEWGPVNSMSVVSYIGAREGLLTRPQLEQYLKDRPDYYKSARI